ncbi:hypothetical protein RRG08_020333, partial [Elysia crispata]
MLRGRSISNFLSESHRISTVYNLPRDNTNLIEMERILCVVTILYMLVSSQ